MTTPIECPHGRRTGRCADCDLAAAEVELAALRACLAEADRLMDHCDEPSAWRERWAALLTTTPPAHRVEVTIWQPASTPPDADTTVLLHHPSLNEPVWSGYRTFDQWFTAEGCFLHDADVKHWAPMPKGPTA